MEGVLLALTQRVFPSVESTEASTVLDNNMDCDSSLVSNDSSVLKQVIVVSSVDILRSDLGERDSSAIKVVTSTETSNISAVVSQSSISSQAAVNTSHVAETSSSSCIDSKSAADLLATESSGTNVIVTNEALISQGLCTSIDNSLLIDSKKTCEATATQSANHAENIDSISAMSCSSLIKFDNQSSGVEKVESLVSSLPPLSDSTLTVPICPQRFLKVVFIPNETFQVSLLDFVIRICYFICLPLVNDQIPILAFLVDILYQCSVMH